MSFPSSDAQKTQADLIDSVDVLVEYVESLGTQFSCFDSCLQGMLSSCEYCRMVLTLLANFKEAGEAKENYDIRKIFDNT